MIGKASERRATARRSKLGMLSTDELVRRIQAVEQEIATVQEQRARAGGPVEDVVVDGGRIADLEARVREAEEKLQAQLTVRRRTSDSPARAASDALRTMRGTFYLIGGVLGVGGIGMTIGMLQDNVERPLLALGIAPAVIGAFMIVTAFRAKTVDDFGADGI